MQVQQTVRVAPEEFLDLVMDIERCAQVDKKISPVLWQRRNGDVVEFACRPKLVGLRQPKVIQYAQLTPGRRIDIGLTPLLANRIAHTLARFQASFECEAVEGGTRVVRTLEFQFTSLVRWLLEPLFRHRLEHEGCARSWHWQNSTLNTGSPSRARTDGARARHVRESTKRLGSARFSGGDRSCPGVPV